jgi:chromatin remodeling complex protein RSC6
METDSPLVTILDTISTLKTQLCIFQSKLKDLERMVKKEYKTEKKTRGKIKEKKEAPKKGFAKPTEVTNELCAFMNKEEGSKIARTDVTKALIEYINQHNLKNIENGQIINPDEKLKILLGVNDTEEVTYFTLQKFMNKHFIKNTESLLK